MHKRGIEDALTRARALSVLLLLLVSVTGGCIYVSGRGILGLGPGPLKETFISGSGADKILLMDVNGIISEQERGGPFRLKSEPSTVAAVTEQLDKASRDSRIKALLLQINSPGGTVAATDIIYHEVKRFKERRGVKVIALLMGTAASGGYYVALAADKIVAHPTTVTGSIGVILLNLNVGGLFEKIGVSDQSIKSGDFKDVGSPFRRPRKGEKEILQVVVDDLYGHFCRVVEANRPNVKIRDNPEVADGRVLTAREALEKGLVDRIGYFEDALSCAKEAAGISEARLVRYERPDEYKPTVYARRGGDGPPEVTLFKLDADSLRLGLGPAFMYLWLP
jgi:protease-4